MKPLRQAVVAIIVNDERQILIGNSPRDGGYKFPQGGLEANEHPQQGLIRELEEELSVVINEKDIVVSFEEKAVYIFPQHLIDERPFRGQELHVFHVKYHSSMKFYPQDDEFDTLYWKTAKEILQMDLSFRRPAYQKALQLCNLI